MAMATRALTRAAVGATARPTAASFASSARAAPRMAAVGFRAAPLATRCRYYSSSSSPSDKKSEQSSSSSSSSGSSSHTPPPPPPQPPKAATSTTTWVLAAIGLAAAAGLVYTQSGSGRAAVKKAVVAGGGGGGSTSATTGRGREDYQKVYDAVAARLEEMDEYEDGSYAPIVLRLAWHCSGTFDAATGTGGSNGATMRFSPEGDHGANAGLKVARDFLEPIKKQFPWISYGDLWVLSGCCAIQQMMGPDMPFRPGRKDMEAAACTPDGRLPDAAKGADHLRAIFGRMGFSDREIVALSGGHAVGRCHSDRSGYDGPWTFSPTVLTNDFFKLLLDEKWEVKKWAGPRQFEDKSTKSLMMLPTDMVLVQDAKFLPWVQKYAADNDVFFNDFQSSVLKLFENGVPFAEGTDKQRWVFKRSE